ncbi:MAG: hypothetical protein H7Y31_00765, partial [Chitinophagaceae bacterium]|nr:hypothetical protein [Chitinophagaceae bacterium]
MNLFLRILLFLFVSLPFLTQAQDTTAKVKWSFSIEKKSGNTYTITASGEIEKDWGLFSIAMADDMPNTRLALDSGSASIKSVSEPSSPIKES